MGGLETYCKIQTGVNEGARGAKRNFSGQNQEISTKCHLRHIKEILELFLINTSSIFSQKSGFFFNFQKRQGDLPPSLVVTCLRANGEGFVTVVVFSMSHCNRSCHQRCSISKGVLRNFAKFTGKHIFRASFLIRLRAQAVSFLQSTSERLLLS